MPGPSDANPNPNAMPVVNSKEMRNAAMPDLLLENDRSAFRSALQSLFILPLHAVLDGVQDVLDGCLGFVCRGSAVAVDASLDQD